MRKFLVLSIYLFSISALLSQEEAKKLKYVISLLPHFGTLTSGAGNGNSILSLGYGLEIGLNKSISKNLDIQGGLNFQKTNLKQRFNNFLWPDDFENGEWVPWKSYEQYKVEYYAFGVTAGLSLKLSPKQNHWVISGRGTLRQVLYEHDRLIINESGQLSEYFTEEIDTELNKTQLFIGGGFSYKDRKSTR